MLRDVGHVVAVVHSEYEGAVGVRVGDCGGGGALSVDCCHSKDGRRSPEIEANIGSRMITWLGSLKRASWISEMPSMHCEIQKECGQGLCQQQSNSALCDSRASSHKL